jgi:mono/diheme cytochrome c family protein
MKHAMRWAFGLGWLAAVNATAANDALAVGKRLFVQGATPPCGVCHALQAAGTPGTIGPSLDEMKPDAARVERVIRSGLGAMPAYPMLTDSEVKAVAEFVARSTGGAK